MEIQSSGGKQECMIYPLFSSPLFFFFNCTFNWFLTILNKISYSFIQSFIDVVDGISSRKLLIQCLANSKQDTTTNCCI